MSEYMTVQEAAELGGISTRRVQRLCKENRIEGVLNVNRVWLIPKSTEKPLDKRRKSERGDIYMNSKILLVDDEKDIVDLMEEVFRQDGF